jgi:hypothetical protein
MQDFEIGAKYQSVAHVVFRDPQSPLRISADSDILHIPAPHIISDRPGGIGLDELEGLLEHQEYVKEGGIPAFENVMESVLQSGRDEKNDRFIECKIQRSSMWYLPRNQRCTEKSHSHNFCKILISLHSAVLGLQVIPGGFWM